MMIEKPRQEEIIKMALGPRTSANMFNAEMLLFAYNTISRSFDALLLEALEDASGANMIDMSGDWFEPWMRKQKEFIQRLYKQISKQKTDASGRLAVVGDRELVIGYRLIGIDDTFIVTDEEDASKKIQELYSSGEFGLIIASNSMRDKLSSKFIAEIEESIEPLVLFMPSQKETAEEDKESIAALAKRVLGISIEVN